MKGENKMIFKKDLTVLKKDIKAIGKKVDNLLKGYEKDAKTKTPKASKKKAVKAKPAQKAPATKRATKITATDKVLKIINRSKKGVDTATIKKKTGFDDRKVRNIIFRTLKEGKIKREGRGVYTGVKGQAPKASKEKAVKTKPAVKESEKMGATKLTATDQILKMVSSSKEGVDIITIKNKTGFEDKKVRNIIFRAYKEGKIQRAERGLYKGVE
jgi:predicted transcriptional regulator of viral defense system